MSLVIEGGTVVAADRSYKADVLVEGETIKAIGEGLRGDSTLDAKDCFVMPGGIDPHTHLDMPFMGTNSADNYESGTKAALSGGTTMVVDFCIPNRNQPLMEAFADWQKRSKDAVSDYSYHMCITYWDNSCARTWPRWSRGRDDLQAFHGLQGRADGQRRADVRLVHALRRTRRDAAGPRRERRNRRRAAEALYGQGRNRAGGPRAVAPAGRRGRSGQSRDHARRSGGRAALHRSRLLHPGARGDQARPRLGKRVYGEPLIQHLVLDESEYYNKDWKHAARRVMSPPFRDKMHQDDLWNGLRAGSLQVVATDHCAFTTKQKELGLTDFTKIPNGTGGLEDRMPVFGPMASRPGG